MYPRRPQWKPRMIRSYALDDSSSPPRRPAPKSYTTTTTTTQPTEEEDRFDEVADIARKGYKLAKELMGELNVEYKVISPVVLFSWSPDFLGQMVQTNSCFQGVTDTTRTGDSIKINNFMIRGTITNQYATPGYTVVGYLRIIVFWQKNTDVITSVFPTTAITSDGLLDFYLKGTKGATIAPKDYDTDATSEILWDKTFITSSTAQGHQFEKLIKLHKHTQYEADSDKISSGVLRVAMVSSQPTADGNKPICNWYYRTYFIDN